VIVGVVVVMVALGSTAGAGTTTGTDTGNGGADSTRVFAASGVAVLPPPRAINATGCGALSRPRRARIHRPMRTSS